jgi:sugar phosphate isomerase/epimerase
MPETFPGSVSLHSVVQGESSVAVDRLSCTDFSFPAPFEGAVAQIAALGITRVDVSVRTRFPLTTPAVLQVDPRGVGASRMRALRELGLRASDVFCMSHEPRPSNDPDVGFRLQEREVFKAVVEFAAQLDAPGITVLPGNANAAGSSSPSFAIAVQELTWRVEVAAMHGLALSVEPSVDSIAATPQAALVLLEAVPGRQLTLDYSHFVYQEIDPAQVDPLLSHARILHVRQARPRRLQAPSPAGVIDFGRVLTAARERFDGTFTL